MTVGLQSPTNPESGSAAARARGLASVALSIADRRAFTLSFLLLSHAGAGFRTRICPVAAGRARGEEIRSDRLAPGPSSVVPPGPQIPLRHSAIQVSTRGT